MLKQSASPLSVMLQYSMPAKQQGVALFISLILLLIITIMGLSSMQTTSMEEKMVANARDHMVAFQAAESALGFASNHIDVAIQNTGSFDDQCTAGLCSELAIDATDYWEDATLDVFGDGSGRFRGPGVSGETPVSGVQKQPRYIIEFYQTVETTSDSLNMENTENAGAQFASVAIYRVTAVGYGLTDNTRVMLQTTIGVAN